MFAPPPGILWSTQVWHLPFLPHPWVPRKLPVTWINHDADQQQRLGHVSSRRRGKADLTERSNRARMACYLQRSLTQCQGPARLGALGIVCLSCRGGRWHWWRCWGSLEAASGQVVYQDRMSSHQILQEGVGETRMWVSHLLRFKTSSPRTVSPPPRPLCSAMPRPAVSVPPQSGFFPLGCPRISINGVGEVRGAS